MIEIYTKPHCPYCINAKKLFVQKNINFVEYDVNSNHELRNQMIKRANGLTTVPQIFINNLHIGGSDDLYALEHANKLDLLLK